MGISAVDVCCKGLNSGPSQAKNINMDVEEHWLRKSGWHIKPQGLLQHLGEDSSSSSSSSIPHSRTRDSLVAQLLDSNLKDVGSPSLPDATSIQRISRLQGPLVLQVVSVRNICQSSSKSLLQSGNDQLGRLLRIYLTDGCTVISAIEYHPMPAFSLDVAPGTKVKLENTVPLQNGFLLGDACSFTILGGRVPALYESWEMERKYSGLSRMTMTKAALARGDSGPPPFHGLHVPRQGKYSIEKKSTEGHQSQQQGVHSKDLARRELVGKELSGSKSFHEKEVMTYESVRGGDDGKVLQHQGIAEMSNVVPEPLSTSWTLTSGASSSSQVESKTDIGSTNVPHESLGKLKGTDVRKDAIKAVMALGVETAPPLQNRAAAQKLLEKRTDFYSKNEGGRSRGGRGRGRRGGRQQEEATLTLDEWEAKRGASSLSRNQVGNTSYVDEASTYDDEALAQRLHYQLNVENTGHATGEAFDEAERIRLSMFSFSGDRGVKDDSGRGHHGGRGRGRGRGRRRGR